MYIFPKFIIETDDELGDCLILSKRTYHKELITNKDKVKGGGWFRYEKETNTFIFGGESHDFGKAKQCDIESCINSGNVFTNPCLAFPITEKHNFSYDSGSEIIKLKQ